MTVLALVLVTLVVLTREVEMRGEAALTEHFADMQRELACGDEKTRRAAWMIDTEARRLVLEVRCLEDSQ